LAGSLQNVDRDEYLKRITEFNDLVRVQGLKHASAHASKS
jgi:hypothetical protein